MTDADRRRILQECQRLGRSRARRISLADYGLMFTAGLLSGTLLMLLLLR